MQPPCSVSGRLSIRCDPIEFGHHHGTPLTGELPDYGLLSFKTKTELTLTLRADAVVDHKTKLFYPCHPQVLQESRSLRLVRQSIPNRLPPGNESS